MEEIDLPSYGYFKERKSFSEYLSDFGKSSSKSLRNARLKFSDLFDNLKHNDIQNPEIIIPGVLFPAGLGLYGFYYAIEKLGFPPTHINLATLLIPWAAFNFFMMYAGRRSKRWYETSSSQS